MEATMLRNHTFNKSRWVLAFLALASLIFTGCENGSLGAKGGIINGFVLTTTDNKPIPQVLVTAKGTATNANCSTFTDGDGSFVLNNLSADDWVITVEKYGYTLTDEAGQISVNVANGETVTAPVIRMEKTSKLYTGILKAYPIDAITGRPLNNFTVNQISPYTQRRSKAFETAADFRDSGWTGLEGGEHDYTITAKNYETFSTAQSAGGGGEGEAGSVSIGASVANLGTIMMQPLTVSISGTLENLPGYAYDNTTQNIVFYAESAGKVVASFSSPLNSESLTGSVIYTLANVPVTAGSVAVKCKIRGYPTHTIKQAQSLNSSTPGGTIVIRPTDFNEFPATTRDVCVIVAGTKPDPDAGDDSTFANGETARIRIMQGGGEVVDYEDVVSVNNGAEAYFDNVPTAYPITISVINQSRKYCFAESEPITIEEGLGYRTVHVLLEEH